MTGKKKSLTGQLFREQKNLITMLRENMEALGEKYEEDVDNSENSKESCGEDRKSAVHVGEP